MANIVVTLFSILLIFFTAAQTHTINESPGEGICKTVVEKQGYTCEEHYVTTGDGFILSLQRMPVGRSGKKANKPPILLQHGIIVDAMTWLYMPPHESLAYVLADSGFDVWLANTRASKYSSGHISLKSSDPAYWDWTLDELIKYDLPASVGYVYNHTGHIKMHYVGHSLGTLTALAALSQGQLVNMFRSASLLCPIAHMDQITSRVLTIAAKSFLANTAYWLGLYELVPNGDVAAKFMKNICDTLRLDCSNLLTIFTGPNCCVSSTAMDVFLENEPQPTSTKNLIHLSQMIRTGKIAKYDYVDPIENMKHYGQSTPPVYNLTKIPKEFPIFLSYGGKDMLSDVNDVESLLIDLDGHNADKFAVLYIEEYAHADFIMGYNAKLVVYDRMISFIGSN